MNRENARADSIQFTKPVRAARPDIVFGADLIASFPKCADDMFATILATNRACRMTVQHIFPHSPRPDTPAARMPQLPGKFVMARAARLRQEGRIARDAVLASETGHRRDVLAELGGTGRPPRFAGVGMQQTPPAGVIVNVIFVGHD
jgi:threonylcarbamoyladenosine tRNA methylthiotransferase MtaB